jgi:acyl-CoA dehydrogenase
MEADMETDRARESDTKEWMARADAIGPLLAASAARHDAEASFVADGYAALREAGFFRALVPAEFGGGGASHRAMCAAVRRLATYDGSTALAFSMHCHLVAVPVWRWRHERAPVEGLLRRVAAEDLVLISSGGSDWLDSGGTATKVEGGFRVTARKAFSSGCPMGDLLMTSAVYDDPAEGATVLHFPVPFKAEGVRVLDTWHVLGMRGTGSHDVMLQDVFVPDAAIGGRRRPGKWHPLFHAIAMLAFPLIYAAYVGVAESARRTALAMARKRPASSALVLAAGRLENAFALAEIAHDRMVAIAESAAIGPETTSRAMTARTLAGRAAIETVERAMEVAGGASFYASAGIERAFRDVQGARFHPLQEGPQLELAGRLALGQAVDP